MGLGPTVKAISLWQPWASFIAVGVKRFETRSWATSYRGPLLICAAKRPCDDFLQATFAGIERALRVRLGLEVVPGAFPLGVGIALVELADCFRTEDVSFEMADEFERTLGDFTPGRFAWQLENLRKVEPFAVKGRQGLFDVPVNGNILLVA